MRSFLGAMGAIIATGALLKLAGDGVFGVTMSNAARYVTTGYGVSN
jgi:hypothetical protein